MRDQVAKYLAAGFDAHLAKPIAMSELCSILESVALGRDVATLTPPRAPPAEAPMAVRRTRSVGRARRISVRPTFDGLR
jgi:hypothetical protein